MIAKNASWIGMPEVSRGRSAPLFRREFSIDRTLLSASLTLCGLGCHEAYLNGKKVGDHVLDPAQTDYDIRCFTVTHDIYAYLHEGPNAIGVMLGDGWFNQDIVWGKNMSYGSPRLIATLEIHFADGSKMEVSTDDSWRCARGPITSNNLYVGENYDARMEVSGWDLSGFSDAHLPAFQKWQPCKLVPAPDGPLEEQALPPMKKIEELLPLSITEPQPCYWVADFGQNFSGWVRFRLQALPGTILRLRFAETLSPDGMVDTASSGVFATRVEQVDTYICKGGGLETWEPRFTYHGFRYVEIVGWPGKPADIVGVVVHTALQPAGAFECSDARLNLLHRMVVWTHRSNIHGFPEDCPVRERCGWLGDAHIICDYSMYNFNGATFWEKFLDDIESSRQRNGGLPTFIAPGKRTGGTASPDWMAAMILIPWTHYVFYGKREVLERHWEGMRAVFEHFKGLSENGLLPHGLGDWFDPGQRAQPTYTPPVKTSTLLFGQCAQIMSKTAALLGHPENAAEYSDWAGKIRTAFREKFYDPARHSFGSQTADAMALQFGFAPEGEERAIVESMVKDISETHSMHFTVGIMGMKNLFEVLTRHGRGDVAFALLQQDSYPSFGDLIRQGATTTWEFWGEKEVEKVHGPRSLSHPMMGGYDGWFYNTLAGIRPDPEHPGFKRFFVEPHPLPGLTWAKAHHDSPQGRIVSEWKCEKGIFTWNITVPADSTAIARLPGCEKALELPPGNHCFQTEAGL